MSASNFHRGATSKVFAVLMDTEETFKECSECGHKHYDYECSLNTLNECENGCEGATFEEQTNYISPDEYEYNDLKDYIRETAQEEIKDLKEVWYREESGSDNARNYSATDLFSFNTSKMFGDIEISVKVIGQIVGAYYEGASLDFSVEFNSEEYTNDEPDFEWLFEYQSEMNKGLQVLQNRNAVKWAEKTKTELIELIEEVFTKVSEPLNVVASFSNGETIYQKA